MNNTSENVAKVLEMLQDAEHGWHISTDLKVIVGVPIGLQSGYIKLLLCVSGIIDKKNSHVKYPPLGSSWKILLPPLYIKLFQ